MQAIEDFLQSLPADRQSAIRTLRETVLCYLPDGYEETFANGMINYVVPHSIFPAGYHCNPKQPLGFAAIANTKGHIALHLMALYMNPKAIDALEADFQAAGKKLVMGKACLRFKNLDDMPLEAIGHAIARFPLEIYVRIYQDALHAPMTVPRGATSLQRGIPAAWDSISITSHHPNSQKRHVPSHE